MIARSLQQSIHNRKLFINVVLQQWDYKNTRATEQTLIDSVY